VSTPGNNLWHGRWRWGVAATMQAYDPINNDHANAGDISQFEAF
jgi:hypothetical protein